MAFRPDKDHRRSIRLSAYDYSQAGMYFVTICSKNRQCLFGRISESQKYQPVMELNEAGKVAESCWSEIPQHFPNAVLHAFIVMPNHVHGIVELVENHVEAKDLLPNQRTQISAFGHPVRWSMGMIIKGYKIGVTKWFRQHTDIHDVWQRNYYEHIIRNEKSYKSISEYIINNPANWQTDKLFAT